MKNSKGVNNINNNNNNNNSNNIHWELSKKFAFDFMKKWYMHNPEAVLENETPKILWDLEIQTDHLISARRPDLVIVNKQEKPVVNFGGVDRRG